MTGCPDLYTLERFVEEKLTGEESTDVSAHVDACGDCGAAIEELRDAALMCASVQKLVPPTRKAHVPAVPGIVIEKEIGRGGQGVVWKGRQEKTGRDVAVKMLSASAFAQPIHRVRFLREVEIAASLRHPNIVTVFDGGETSDGDPYLVMEWVDGRRIDEWSAEKGRTIEEIVGAFKKVADGVRHAHRHGVLHRDLKPGNVLVAKDGVPRVLDFGLAKRIDDAELSTATRTDEFVGTVLYAAPEQLDRKDGDGVDLLTDIHALGAVLYAMLTGRAPYMVDGNLHATIQAVVTAEPPRASAKRADVDRDLDAVIRKALAKRRDDRYQSIDQMLEDLERRDRGEVLIARRGERRHVALKTLRRYWAPAAITALFFVVLATATVVSWTAMREADRARNATTDALARRDKQAKRAEDVVDSFKKALNTASPYESSANYKMSDFAVAWSKSLDVRPPTLPETEFTMRMSLSSVFRTLDRSGDAEREARRALAVAETATDIDPIEKLDAEMTLIESLSGQNKREEWRARFADFRKRAEGVVPRRSSLGANIRIFEVLDCMAGNDEDRGLELARKYLDELKADPDVNTGLVLRLMSLELTMLRAGNRLPEAVEVGQEIIELRRTKKGLADTESIYVMVSIADSMRLLGRFDEAEALVTEAIALARPIMRPTQAVLMHAVLAHSKIRLDQSDYMGTGEILEEFAKADAVERYPDPVEASYAYRALAVHRERVGNKEEAARFAELSARRLDGARAPIDQIIDAYRVWGIELENAERIADAYRADLSALKRLEGLLPPTAPLFVDIRLVAADRAFRADMLAEAIALYREILALAPGGGAPSPTIARTLVLERLAKVLEEDDQDAEAKKVREEASRLRESEKH